ncbi:MAG: hypothetical protein CFE34_12160 [Rhodobacteraceae bacterium PARR1]|nr:MAG: hypothetical protein CFE34_12160 [Rhodobacteraceae bacterium PARR1]
MAQMTRPYAPQSSLKRAMRPWVNAAVAALLALGLAKPAQSEARGSPEVLVLGDSQLTFGAGAAFVDLLTGMSGTCGLGPEATTGVIGVRSSSLLSWSGRTKAAKGAICNVDPKWRVNAAAYGTLSQGQSPFVQIGRGAQFQFCTPDRSPLRAVFHDGYFKPKLVIMFLMGNAADRWAGSLPANLTDALAVLTQAQRPLAIAGVDAVNEGAGPAITAFCRAHGIPLITTYKGKGLMPEGDPLCLGGAGVDFHPELSRLGA